MDGVLNNGQRVEDVAREGRPVPKQPAQWIKVGFTRDEYVVVLNALVEYEKVTKNPAAVTAAIAVVGAKLAAEEAI